MSLCWSTDTISPTSSVRVTAVNATAVRCREEDGWVTAVDQLDIDAEYRRSRQYQPSTSSLSQPASAAVAASLATDNRNIVTEWISFRLPLKKHRHASDSSARHQRVRNLMDNDVMTICFVDLQSVPSCTLNGFHLWVQYTACITSHCQSCNGLESD